MYIDNRSAPSGWKLPALNRCAPNVISMASAISNPAYALFEQRGLACPVIAFDHMQYTGANCASTVSSTRRSPWCLACCSIRGPARSIRAPAPLCPRQNKFAKSAPMPSTLRPAQCLVQNRPLALLVSNTMAVGMLRVTPAILPPTIMAQPTSEITRPKPLSSAATNAKRTSKGRHAARVTRDRQGQGCLAHACRPPGSRASAKAAKTGNAMIACPNHRLLRVKQLPIAKRTLTC